MKFCIPGFESASTQRMKKENKPEMAMQRKLSDQIASLHRLRHSYLIKKIHPSKRTPRKEKNCFRKTRKRTLLE